MRLINSSTNSLSSSNNKIIIVLLGIVFFLFVVIVEVVPKRETTKTTVSEPTASRGVKDVSLLPNQDDASSSFVVGSSAFTSLDSEFEWDTLLIPGNVYQPANRDENNNSASATKRNTERTLVARLNNKNEDGSKGNLRQRRSKDADHQ
mmetsp:Transcript_52883/g.59117  ORF Transcript_52883/g.59117 Transcript_52883/m.59117 type:complete len:149 (-) Transcript_52883:320-766(-)|eukprot:CAMPEP_0170991086 /NCGR_PEP_ID=MMETSP0736-20130129/8895_1 /TAXON_ID=186038 /ORGANISM="Fragilariopsis kerguelensis, Strain L26-C5" /LENGTH=148 /DNA_ID=CAMNT_0011416199 /DNA_START=13 /DNA_END=459 /DNA_ORIENTATION=+